MKQRCPYRLVDLCMMCASNQLCICQSFCSPINEPHPPERCLHGESGIYGFYQTAYHPLVTSSLHFEGSVLIVSSHATMYEQSMNHIFLNNFAVTSWHIQVYKITNCTDLAAHNKLAHIRIVTLFIV